MCNTIYIISVFIRVSDPDPGGSGIFSPLGSGSGIFSRIRIRIPDPGVAKMINFVTIIEDYLEV